MIICAIIKKFSKVVTKIYLFYFSYQRRSMVQNVALILCYYQDYSMKVTEPSNETVVSVYCSKIDV